MFSEKITFDRFIRGLMIILGFVGVYFLLNRLSSVLWPFFVAWLLAYMIYPLVIFLEKKCHLRFRILSIIAALAIVLGVTTGVLYLVIPPTIEAVSKLSDDFTQFVSTYVQDVNIQNQLMYYINKNVDANDVLAMLQKESTMSAIRGVLAQTWDFLYGTMNFLLGLLHIFIILLYFFFILMDYEKISKGFKTLIPKHQRSTALMVINDVEKGMNSYFRGQALVATCVGILFSIGFLIIGFPMAIGLGLSIGILSMIPYMHTLGLLPTVLLALLKANDTGESFWVIMACALVVFAVVQCIEDMVLVPKIMGKVMGLNPAVILLSLSIWGSLLGIIGFIIALPVTTLIWSYYKRYVLAEENA